MNPDSFVEQFDQFADVPNAVEKMRELVLQLALRGRLAAPAANDEPVEHFLRRIWADKTGNRTELPAAAKAQPFALPAHWRWAVLGEVAEFSIGKTPPRGDSRYWSPETHSWVSIADMKHYRTIGETKERVSALAAQEVFRHRFAEPGSILMSFKLTIGKVARAGTRCFHNEAIISLHPPESELAEYLFRFLPIFATLQTSNNAVKGSTLNKGLLTYLPIALPPLAEQRRIVAKVDALMALCDRLAAQQQERETRHVALARASLARFADAPTPGNLHFLFHSSYAISPADLRKSILTLAVRGKLLRQDPTDEPAGQLLARVLAEKRRLLAQKIVVRNSDSLPDEETRSRFVLPTSWVLTTLGEIGLINPRNEADDALDASFVPMKMISAELGVPHQHEVRKWSEIRSAFTHFAEGDVSLAKITPCFENGKSAVMRGLANGIGAGTTELHVVRPILVDADYILIFLKSPLFIESGIPRMTGTAGQKRVPTSYFAESPFPLPPLAEQRRIVARVAQLMTLVDQLETKLAASRALGGQLLEAVVAALTLQRTT